MKTIAGAILLLAASVYALAYVNVHIVSCTNLVSGGTFYLKSVMPYIGFIGESFISFSDFIFYFLQRINRMYEILN